jgi:hypothetical protein
VAPNPQYTWHRSELIDRGVSRSALRRQLKREDAFRRIRRGAYAQSTNDPEEKWRQDLEAFLRRSGPGAVVGLRSAARLHRLDGFANDGSIDTLTTASHHALAEKVHRTRTLQPDDIVEVDGFPCTSLTRTLFDLGRVCNSDEVELALESALRGPDPRRPDVWNEVLLADLEERTRRVVARTGGPVLRAVLRRRPKNCRPTGSFAETKFAQATRRAAMEPFERQLDVRIFDKRGRRLHHFFPDFTDVSRLILIEVNGSGPRDGTAMTVRDLARMNRLQPFFRFHVVTGADAIFNQRSVANAARELRQTEPMVGFPCVRRGYRIDLTPTGVDLFEL